MSKRIESYGFDNTEKNTDTDLTFHEWMCEVDRLVTQMCGMSVMDLADFPSHDTWSDGVSPDEALYTVAEYDDLFASILEMNEEEHY